MIHLKKCKGLLAGSLFILFIISLFHHLGVQPLYVEEPRRALIALEVLFNRNFIVPTEFGAYYYNKPPLWNWVIIASFKLFGSFSETAVRFFTPVSFLFSGFIIFFISKRYVDIKFAVLNSFFYLVSVDLYIRFSPLGEIDIFYSFLSYLGIVFLFIFYESKKFYLLFISFYFLHALGFLTKGFPSIAMIGISLSIFFIYKKDFKRLFSFQHSAGILVFILVTGLYFYIYNQYNDAFYYLKTLWNGSSSRTIAFEDNILKFIGHFLTFPFQNLLNTLPVSVFFIFLFKKELRNKIISNPLTEFSFYILIANVSLYWLSPGSRPRYVYMLYPFIITISTYIFYHVKDRNTLVNKIFYYMMIIVPVAGLIVSSGLIFFESINKIPHILAITLIFGSLFLFVLVLFFRCKKIRIYLFIFSLILARFLFNSTVIPYRAIDSWAQKNKDDAGIIAEIAHGEEIYMYRENVSRTMVFYLEKYTQQIISKKYYFKEDLLFIVPEICLPATDITILHEFFNKNEHQKYYFIRY